MQSLRNFIYGLRAALCELCFAADNIILGVERNSDFAREQVFHIIDSRYRSGLPTIVTTNLTLKEMKEPPDLARSRIYDRVLERCVPGA